MGRGYDIVPPVQRIVKNDLFGESFLEGLAYFPLRLVHLVHDGGKDFETCLSDCLCGSLTGVDHGDQRCAAPGTRDLGEEAVFDGVELGAVRRVVHDEDFQPQPVGQVHEVLLDDMVSAGVGTAPIAEDDEHFRVGVECTEVLSPDAFYVVAHELGGVVAGADGEESQVVGDVVDAVRDDCSVGERLEVVVVVFRGVVAVHLPVTLEIANHLFLLGVDADDGDSELQTGGLGLVYLPELRVSVRDHIQRDAFGERPLFEAGGLEHLLHQVRGHFEPPFEKLAPDLRHAYVEPHRALVLRETGHVVGDDVLKGGHPLGVLAYFAFGTAARPSYPALTGTDVVAELAFSSVNGVFPDFQNRRQTLHGDLHESHRLGGEVTPSIVFVERSKERYFRICDYNWRIFHFSCNRLKINYKDTKFSPVFLCYFSLN